MAFIFTNVSSGGIKITTYNYELTSIHTLNEINKILKDKIDCLIVFKISSFEERKKFLNNDTGQIINSENAGGSSIYSEAIAFDILRIVCNAKLKNIETNVIYSPEGGSKIDFEVFIDNKLIGVSVTRAIKFDKYRRTLFDNENDFITDLITKKIQKFNNAEKNVIQKWDAKILMIWLYDESLIKIIYKVYSSLNIKDISFFIISSDTMYERIFIK